MARWRQFLKERAPLWSLLLISAGAALSSLALSEISPARAWPLLLLQAAALSLFLFQARCMDELKDYPKDLAAHPRRPLPRGLIRPEEMRRAITNIMTAMGAAAGIFAFAGGAAPAILYAAAGLYLWLMYREFYAGGNLGGKPLLYGLSHQLVVVPLYLSAAAFWSGWAFSPALWAFVLGNLCASFAYEIGRKLDPKAHPALGTYLQVLGRGRTLGAAALLSVLAALCAWFTGYGAWIIAFDMLVLAGLLAYAAGRAGHKAVEALAALASLAHLWAPAIARFAAEGGMQRWF